MRGLPHHEPDHRTALSAASLIDGLIQSGVTFAAFREPGQEAIAYVQADEQLRPAHAGQRCFVVAPFDRAEAPPLAIRPDRILRADGSHVAHSSVLEHGSDPARNGLSGLSRDGYKAAVSGALQEIRAGRLEKAVLARTIAAKLNGLHAGALFEAACRMNSTAFVAVARTNRFGLWMGASPERLLMKDGDRIEVDSLAGTLPKDAAPARAEHWGVKEREEQEIVTAEIIAGLRALGIRDAKAGDIHVKSAANVAHLHTRITGTMPKCNALAIAEALHPTPAVCGRPEQKALELIRSAEPRPRALYSGYWGPMEADRASFFVNIRCMELFPDHGLLHVGAGITAGSDPDRECDEVERKARTWLDLIDALGQHG